MDKTGVSGGDGYNHCNTDFSNSVYASEAGRREVVGVVVDSSQETEIFVDS